MRSEQSAVLEESSEPEDFADILPLDEDYEGPRDLPVHTVVSADGTTIAYEKSGTGPPVVVIGGGLNDRAMFTPMATIMSRRFTVINYDRRGRGASGVGDLDSWSIQREVEDLVAVLDAIGEPAHIFANCTGGMIAIHAAAAGVPMRKLALYEPPYWSPPATAEQLTALRRIIAEGRAEEAVTIFARDVVGFLTDEAIEGFKSHPAWRAFLSMAPSTYYDAIISKDHTQLPLDLISKITVPLLVMRGDIGEEEIHKSCERIAQEVPDAMLLTMGGCTHLFDQKKWSPLVMAFFEA